MPILGVFNPEAIPVILHPNSYHNVKALVHDPCHGRCREFHLYLPLAKRLAFGFAVR